MDRVIYTENLSLSYKNHEPIIKDISFSVHSKEFVFITGASGSGKSTLLKSLYGSMQPTQGKLIVGGVDMNSVTKKKLNFLRRHLGIVFQDYKLIKDWTIERNVGLPLMISGYAKNVIDPQVTKLLTHVKLSHQIGKYPMELSGGEQQRVAMARALSHNPVLILADEPTGNLDEYSSSVIWDLLVGANEQLKSTVVVVTHNIPESLGIPYTHYHIEDGKINEVT